MSPLIKNAAERGYEKESKVRKPRQFASLS